jgi:hypothetical protein
MIQDVFMDHSTYAAPPSRFEVGAYTRPLLSST